MDSLASARLGAKSDIDAGMAITIHHGTDNKRVKKLVHSTPPLTRSDNQPDNGDATIGFSVQRASR